MKKTVIAVLCAVLVIVALTVFLKKDKPDDTTPTTVSATEDEATEAYSAYEPEGGTKDPEKLVKITMPLSMYDAENQCDTGGFFKKSSYEKCEVNKSQKTFTVTVKSITHDFMLSNVGLQVIKALGYMLDSGDYPYIKQLGNYNSDFSEIEIIVDATGYRLSSDAKGALEFVADCGIYYQLYTTQNSYSCKVTAKDIETGKVIDEITAKKNNKNAD